MLFLSGNFRGVRHFWGDAYLNSTTVLFDIATVYHWEDISHSSLSHLYTDSVHASAQVWALAGQNPFLYSVVDGCAIKAGSLKKKTIKHKYEL